MPLVLGVAACDDGSPSPATTWQGEVTLAPIDGWVALDADADPFADRPDTVECPDYGAVTEEGIFEVLTDVCRYGSFVQPLPVELQPGDVGGHAADTRPGTVGGGGQAPGQGLLVDIGHIDQRHACLIQRLADIPEAAAPPEGCLQGVRVRIDDPAEARQGDDDIVGGHQRGK